MRMRILVTGHTGFVGQALLAALARVPDREVVGASRSTGRDLLGPDPLHGVEGITRIVHLAGAVGVPESWRDPRTAFETNFTTTLRVLEFAREHRVPVIHLSSYLYGTPVRQPIDEAHPIGCNNPYASSKWQAELLCESYARYFAVPVTVLRPFNLYGPGQSRDSLLPHLIFQALHDASIQVKDLRPRRDFLHVDDLVAALLAVLGAEQTGYEVYNLGSGASRSVAEVIQTVFSALGRELPVHCAETIRTNEIMDCRCDASRFARKFGWAPRVDFEAGVRGLIEWCQLAR
jgi:nucleoside-diphosphate-sugar epimerase